MKEEKLCDCKYKPRCHELRQALQVEIKQELNVKIEESCIFYKSFIKKYINSKEGDNIE